MDVFSFVGVPPNHIKSSGHEWPWISIETQGDLGISHSKKPLKCYSTSILGSLKTMKFPLISEVSLFQRQNGGNLTHKDSDFPWDIMDNDG